MDLSTYLKGEGRTSTELGRMLGVAHSTVIRWAAGQVPAERVKAVSAATGIPLHELRPDLFDAPAHPAPSEPRAA